MSQQCCTQSHYGKLDLLNFEFDTFPQQLDTTAVLQSTILDNDCKLPTSKLMDQCPNFRWGQLFNRWVSKDPYQQHSSHSSSYVFSRMRQFQQQYSHCVFQSGVWRLGGGAGQMLPIVDCSAATALPRVTHGCYVSCFLMLILRGVKVTIKISTPSLMSTIICI